MRLRQLSVPALMLAVLPGMVMAACGTPGKDGSVTISAAPSALVYFKPSGNSSGSTIPVASTTGLAAGDQVLIIQMQGANLSTGSSDTYGDGVAGAPASGYLTTATFNAGFYEYGVVQSVTGTQITLAAALTNAYTIVAAPQQRTYQVIRVPQYGNLSLAGNINATAWNGSTGGVLAFDVAGDLNFNGYTIEMNGRGFRGGLGRALAGDTGGNSTDYRTVATKNYHGSKGEGLAGTPRYVWNQLADAAVDAGVEGYTNGSYARGAPANAGGGGNDGNPGTNDQNSGGGGGGNGGAGAQGGNSWSSNLAVGGYGGTAFTQASVARVVMGGGGGAGTRNNSSGNMSSGGTGGGIVLLRVNRLVGSGTVSANGADGSTPVNDGGGGGGGGGSVIVLADGQSGAIALNAVGGNGGNADPGGQAHGPGGGGGGGRVFSNAAVTATVNTVQGTSGYTVSAGNYYGATATGGVVGSAVPNSDPTLVVGADSGYECVPPLLTIAKTADVSGAAPGSQITYTVTVTNSSASKAYNVVLSDAMSVFTNFVPNAMAGANFQLVDSVSNPSGLTLGTATYSENNGSTYSAMPGTSGWETRLTNWRLTMTGNMNKSGQFSIVYKGVVQ
ncbi:MAG: DUF11 domain-containing protein [bacterium]|nr:DUF11 domain-containing protein [bacterium]